MEFNLLFIVTIVLMILFFIIMLITLRDINNALEESESQAIEAFDHMNHCGGTEFYSNSTVKDDTATENA